MDKVTLSLAIVSGYENNNNTVVKLFLYYYLLSETSKCCISLNFGAILNPKRPLILSTFNLTINDSYVELIDCLDYWQLIKLM